VCVALELDDNCVPQWIHGQQVNAVIQNVHRPALFGHNEKRFAHLGEDCVRAVKDHPLKVVSFQ